MSWAVARSKVRNKPTTWDIREMVARYAQPSAVPQPAPELPPSTHKPGTLAPTWHRWGGYV